MSKFIRLKLLVFAIMFTSSSIATSYRNQIIEEYKITIGGRHFIAIPLDDDFKSTFFDDTVNLVPDSTNPTTCKGTYHCYQCCTGESKIDGNDAEDYCKDMHNNWKKGYECGCEK